VYYSLEGQAEQNESGPAARGGRQPAQAGRRSLRGYFNENVRPVENRWTRGVDSSRWTKNVR